MDRSKELGLILDRLERIKWHLREAGRALDPNTKLVKMGKRFVPHNQDNVIDGQFRRVDNGE